MADCRDTRPCFARLYTGVCTALSLTYKEDGKCLFCKDEKEVTNGKKYPYGGEEVKNAWK